MLAKKTPESSIKIIKEHDETKPTKSPNPHKKLLDLSSLSEGRSSSSAIVQQSSEVGSDQFPGSTTAAGANFHSTKPGTDQKHRCAQQEGVILSYGERLDFQLFENHWYQNLHTSDASVARHKTGTLQAVGIQLE